MIKEQFIPFELAAELKELGFTYRCFAYYDMQGKLWPMGTVFNGDDLHFGVFHPKYQYKPDLEPLVAAPLWQQAFDFFRYTYQLEGYVQSSKVAGAYYTINNLRPNTDNWAISSHRNTYMQAKIDCLEALIGKVKEIVSK